VVLEGPVVVAAVTKTLYISFFSLLFIACSVEQNSDTPGATLCGEPTGSIYSDFLTLAQPIINTKCVGCHTSTGTGKRLSFFGTQTTDFERQTNFCIAVMMGPLNSQRALSEYPTTQGHKTVSGGTFFFDADIADLKTWVNRYAR